MLGAAPAEVGWTSQRYASAAAVVARSHPTPHQLACISAVWARCQTTKVKTQSQYVRFLLPFTPCIFVGQWGACLVLGLSFHRLLLASLYRWRVWRAATLSAPSTACAPTTRPPPTWGRVLVLPHASPRSWPLRTYPPTRSQKWEVSARTRASGITLPLGSLPGGVGCAGKEAGHQRADVYKVVAVCWEVCDNVGLLLYSSETFCLRSLVVQECS